MIKSLLVGISAPAFLSLAVPAVHDVVPAPPPEESGQQMSAPAPSSGLAVFAMANTRAAAQSTRQLTVETNFPVVDNGAIYILDPQTGHKEIVEKNLDGSWSVSTNGVHMVYGGLLSGPVHAPVESDPVEIIPGNDPIVLRVTIKQTFLGGFFGGLRLDELALQFIRANAEPEAETAAR